MIPLDSFDSCDRSDLSGESPVDLPDDDESGFPVASREPSEEPSEEPSGPADWLVGLRASPCESTPLFGWLEDSGSGSPIALVSTGGREAFGVLPGSPAGEAPVDGVETGAVGEAPES